MPGKFDDELDEAELEVAVLLEPEAESGPPRRTAFH